MSSLIERFFEFTKNDLGQHIWLAKDGSDKTVGRSDRSFKTKTECTQDAYQHGYDAAEMRHEVKTGDEFWIKVKSVPEERMRKKGMAVFVNGWPGGKLLEGLFEMREARRAV